MLLASSLSEADLSHSHTHTHSHSHTHFHSHAHTQPPTPTHAHAHGLSPVELKREMLALRLAVARTLGGGPAAMTRVDWPSLLSSLREMVHAVNPAVHDSRWLSVLRFLSVEVQRCAFFSFPEVLTLALVQLIAANGHAGFDSLSFSLEEIDSRRHTGELTLCFVHTFPPGTTTTAAAAHGASSDVPTSVCKQQWLEETVQNLEQVMTAVGGSLRVPLFAARSRVELQLCIPFRLEDDDLFGPSQKRKKEEELTANSAATQAESEYGDNNINNNNHNKNDNHHNSIKRAWFSPLRRLLFSQSKRVTPALTSEKHEMTRTASSPAVPSSSLQSLCAWAKTCFYDPNDPHRVAPLSM